MGRAVTTYCPYCQREVVAVEHKRVTGTRVVALGVFALAAKKRDALSCPSCGSPLKAGTVPPRRAVMSKASAPGEASLGQEHWKRGQYRCSKNGHRLTAKDTTCPIDGSVVRKVT